MKEFLINKNGLAISEISNVTNNGNLVSFETKLLDNNANVKFDIYNSYGDWEANVPSSGDESTLPYEEIFDQKQIIYSPVEEGDSIVVKYYFDITNGGPSCYIIMTSLDGIEFTSEDFNKILYNVAIIADDDVMGDGSKLVSSLVAWPTSGPIHRVAIGAANTTFNANSIKVVDRTDDMSQVDLYGENGDIVHSMVFSAESNKKADSIHLTYDEMEGTDIYYDTFVGDNGQTMYNYYASKTNYNRMYHVTITTSENYTVYDEYYERYGISELLMNFKCIATTSDENQDTNYNEYKVSVNTSDFLVRAIFEQDCKITSEPESESTGYGLTDIYFYSDLVQGCRLQYSIFDAMPEEMNDTDNITDLGSLGNSGLQVYQYTVIPETSYAYIYQHSGTGAWIRITDTTGIEATFVDAISIFIDNVSLA